jgi:hypothetical protein
MPNEITGAPGVSNIDAPQLDGPAALDADGERAAGWLSEALSQPESPSAVSGDTARAPSATGNTMGDRILNSLQSVGDAYKATTGRITEALDANGNEGMSLVAALRWQLELTTVSLQADVATKGISKVPQQLDQLTRVQ